MYFKFGTKNVRIFLRDLLFPSSFDIQGKNIRNKIRFFCFYIHAFSWKNEHKLSFLVGWLDKFVVFYLERLSVKIEFFAGLTLKCKSHLTKYGTLRMIVRIQHKIDGNDIRKCNFFNLCKENRRKFILKWNEQKKYG